MSNINACTAIVETIKTTLGPRGLDKLIYQGRTQTISNDGATIMKLLDIIHPAAKMLVQIAKSQDEEVRSRTCCVYRACAACWPACLPAAGATVARVFCRRGADGVSCRATRALVRRSATAQRALLSLQASCLTRPRRLSRTAFIRASS